MVGPTRAVGALIELHRKRSGLSRRTLAELVGRSEEWLRQVERGDRELDSVRIMLRLAELLQISDLSRLIGTPLEPGAGPDHHLRLGELERRLFYSPLVPEAMPPEVTISTPSETIEDVVGRAWDVWNDSPRRYTKTAEHLPTVLAGVQLALLREALPSPEAHRVAGEAYALARSFLSAINERWLAMTAALQGLTTVQASRDQHIIAARAHGMSLALSKVGRPAEARELAEVTARQLSEQTPPSPQGIVLQGALELVAARASAVLHDVPDTEAHLAAAGAAGRQLGGDDIAQRVPFGPTHVKLEGVRAMLRLGRVGRALRQAQELNPADTVPAGIRARHHIVVANAHLRSRDDVAAVYTLLKAADVCAEELRFDALARQTLMELMRRDHASTRRDVSKLARMASILT